MAIIPETRFGLIRHARTLWNAEKRIQGHGDSPLTPEGEAHARRWAKTLVGKNWNRILCSDTGRAIRTAEIINQTLNVSLEKDARLREQNWGRWTGMTIAEVDTLLSEKPDGQDGVGWQFRPPEGESRTETWRRGHEALLEAARTRPGQLILVVTHGGMIRCLVNRCLGFGFLVNEPKVLESGCLHMFTCQDGLLRIEMLNALSSE